MTQPGGSDLFAPWDDPDESPLIEFRNVRKDFGTSSAIQDVNLDIFSKEFFALLGPSGCGKTTLMRMLAGFETPTEGQIFLDGVDIGSVPPHRRAVNMMFQSYALFPHLSVRDNIAFGLKRSDMPRDAIEARVEEMLRLTRLEGFAARKPHQISGGQKQRVALARALAKAPKLLLLDEPLGALDKKLRRDTQFELVDIQEKTGTTFVIVTHDQEEAMTIATRVGVMDQGRIVQVATPDQIYEAPNSVYVADFIGDVNIFEGTVERLAGGLVQLSWAESQRPVCGAPQAIFGVGQRAFLALRPEKVAISKDRPDRTTNVVNGQILDIAYLGPVTTYHVKVAGGAVLKAQIVNHNRLSRADLTWEDSVWLSWDDDAGVVLAQ